MLSEFIEASLKAGIIVGLISFAMVYWSLRKGYIDKPFPEKKRRRGKKTDALDDRIDQQITASLDEPEKGNFLHRKWVKFGGGYYGIIALLTYAVVELDEVWTFITQFKGFSHFIDTISIGLLVDFFINSLMNFVTAIAWPAFWIGKISSAHIWIWFMVSYGAYYIGSSYADVFLARQHLDRAD